jgi:hypothetical protein
MSLESIKKSKKIKALGELGELIGIKALVDAKYTNVSNLNDKKMNFPFADLLAEKDGKKYVISIKARNKIQLNGKLNSSYKLGKGAYEKATIASKQNSNAIPAWLVISFSEHNYSVYFGTLKELNNSNVVSIVKCISGELGVCLVKDKSHYFDWDFFTNK